MVKSTKVLHVTPFFPPDRGGISNVVANLGNGLSQLGNMVEVVAPKKFYKSESSSVSYPVYRIASIFLPGWPYPTLKSMSIPCDLGFTLKKIVKDGSFDLIHVHGHHYPISWFALNIAHKLGIHSILTLHGMYALNPNVMGGKSKLEDWFNRSLFSKVLTWTEVVIGGTEQIIAHAKRFGPDTTKYCIIPTGGVNIDRFVNNVTNKKEYRSKYNLRQDSIVVLFIGRMEAVKGVLEFTKAVNEIVSNRDNNVEIVIVGDGSLRKEVELISTNSSRIHLISWQSPKSIHEIYIASDIFVMPSRFEAFPLTIIEAMNAGLHIVYTPVGGMPEILSQYSPKTLLDAVSVKHIYKVVNDVIRQIRAYRKTASLEYAQKFSWSNICRETNALYESIMASGSKSITS